VKSDPRRIGSALLAVASIAHTTGMAGDNGPVVPGVKSCTIEDSHGIIDFNHYCHWSQVCCIAPVYGPCPFPPGGTCLIWYEIECCDPLEDCWYQRQGTKFVVWCGDPFPPLD
jgi:hypothetical protein